MSVTWTIPPPPMKEFSSGARSTVAKPRYDLVPIEGIQYCAERMELGAASHGPRNFMKGVNDPAFIQDRKNHLFEHAKHYLDGTTVVGSGGRVDTPLDHLKAVLANACMLAALEEGQMVMKQAGGVSDS
jgi:hypothetical protein